MGRRPQRSQEFELLLRRGLDGILSVVPGFQSVRDRTGGLDARGAGAANQGDTPATLVTAPPFPEVGLGNTKDLITVRTTELQHLSALGPPFGPAHSTPRAAAVHAGSKRGTIGTRGRS